MTTADKGSFFAGLKMVLSFKPYMLLSGAFLFLSLAIAVSKIHVCLTQQNVCSYFCLKHF